MSSADDNKMDGHDSNIDKPLGLRVTHVYSLPYFKIYSNFIFQLFGLIGELNSVGVNWKVCLALMWII